MTILLLLLTWFILNSFFFDHKKLLRFPTLITRLYSHHICGYIYTIQSLWKKKRKKCFFFLFPSKNTIRTEYKIAALFYYAHYVCGGALLYVNNKNKIWFFFFIWFNWVLLLLYILDIKKQLCRTQFYFSVERFLFAIFLFYTPLFFLFHFGLPGTIYAILYWNTYVYIHIIHIIQLTEILYTRVFPYLAHKSLLRKEHVRMFITYMVWFMYTYVSFVHQTIYLKCPSFERSIVWCEDVCAISCMNKMVWW